MGCITSKCKSKSKSKSKSCNKTVISKHKIDETFHLKKTITPSLLNEILNCEEFKSHEWGFENLAIEGAGTNGTVTIGAYKILEQIGILRNIKKYIGSSSGSIFAAFASVKMSSSYVEKIFIDFNMDDIKDDSFGVFRDLDRLTNNYGYYKGDVLESFIEKSLEEHTGISKITFYQVREKYGTLLYITRANVTKLRTEYLSVFECPDMPISEAVRQSGSIPLVFKAPITDTGDIITDGMLSSPYPIDFFDEEGSYNKKTLGLKIMESNLEVRTSYIRNKLGYKITNLMEFIEALITFQSIMIERLSIKPGYWERTITLGSPGRRVSDFYITIEEKIKEIHYGAIDTVIALTHYIDEGHF